MKVAIACSFALVSAACFCSGASQAAPAKSVAKSSKPSTLRLTANVSEQALLCGAAGILMDDSKVPGIVTKVKLGSAAAACEHPVVEGDKILNAAMNGRMLTLLFERNGSRYQTTFEIRLDVHRAQLGSAIEDRRPVPKLASSASASAAQNPVLRAQTPDADKFFKAMSPYQVVLLIDHSGSMNGGLGIGPYDLSRWAWCRNQITDFSRFCGDKLKGGITVVPFNDEFEAHEHATEKDVEDVFNTIVPSGETDICSPLAYAIDTHLAEPDHENHPVLIVVLTDGIANKGGSLDKLIAQATAALRKHDEIIITFLTVGQAPEGDELIERLDNDLTRRGASQDIVDSMPFSELLQSGLKNALLDTVTRADSRKK